jgi:hypothetical protein
MGLDLNDLGHIQRVIHSERGLVPDLHVRGTAVQRLRVGINNFAVAIIDPLQTRDALNVVEQLPPGLNTKENDWDTRLEFAAQIARCGHPEVDHILRRHTEGLHDDAPLSFDAACLLPQPCDSDDLRAAREAVIAGVVLRVRGDVLDRVHLSLADFLE